MRSCESEKMLGPYLLGPNDTEENGIYCGDARELAKAIPDESVDLIFTDPPYGHNNNNGDLISRREAALGRGDYVPERDNRPIDNDGMEANELFKEMLPEFYRILKPGHCCCCCCCGGGPDPQFARWSMWMNEVFEFKQMVVWDKGPMGMGWHYRRSYETVLVAKKPGAACEWYDTSRKIENIIRPGAYGIRKIIPSKEQHPTLKPRQLAALFIRLHTQPGDIVLDVFSGAGTTIQAAAILGRRWLGFELNNDWIQFARCEVQSTHPSLFSLLQAPEQQPEPVQSEMELPE